MDRRQINKNDYPSDKSLKDKILFLLNFAIFAPSTHNTQPWLFKIEDNKCSILFDKKLSLKEADPDNRYLTISLACALENLIIAAKYFGIYESHTIAIDFEAGKFAEVRFNENGNKNLSLEYLVDAILVRRNARGFFESEELSDRQDVVELLSSEGYLNNTKVNFITEKSLVKNIATATSDGLIKTYKNKNFRLEMSEWMHNNLTSKKDGMPGYSLRMPFVASFILPTLVRFFDIGKLLGKLNKVSIDSAPAVGILSSNQNSPSVWAEMGRVFERLNLEFVSRGFYSSVFVASLEGETLNAEKLNLDSKPQFLFAIGKPKYISKLAPRYGVEEKLIR